MFAFADTPSPTRAHLLAALRYFIAGVVGGARRVTVESITETFETPLLPPPPAIAPAAL